MRKKSNSKKIGNRFQEDFENSIPRQLAYERLKDAPAKYKKVHNPSDYILFTGKQLLYIECKTTNETRFPLANVSYEQFMKMIKQCDKFNTFGGYLIEFRKLNTCYFIEAGQFALWLIENPHSRSIPYGWIQNNCYKVARKLIVRRYRYGIPGVIALMEEEKYV